MKTSTNQHVRYLGYIYLAFAALGILLGGFVFFVLTGGGLLAGDAGAAFALSTAGTLIGLFFVILALPSFFLGIGLLMRKQWSVTLGYVVGALSLFHFPIGTAVGVYTFWVLLQHPVDRVLD